MAVSFRVSGKFKLKRSSYKRGHKKNQESGNDLQEFIFDNDENSDDEINVNETFSSSKLRKRGTENEVELQQKSTHPKIRKHFLDYEVQPSDTLQSISLRFGCQVAELKQANKFITDQDFYAHRSIQIPVPEHSVLSEELAKFQHTSQRAIGEEGVVNLSIGQMLADDSSMASQSFLEAMDKDIQHIVETTQSQVHSETEVLSMPRFHTMATPPLIECDGSNWGLNWYCLIVVLLIIGVVTPILYGLYQASEAASNTYGILNTTYNNETSRVSI